MRLHVMLHRLLLLCILIAVVNGMSSKGSTPSNMTEREWAMLEEINYARTRPAEYAGYIKEYLNTSRASNTERTVAKELYQVLTTMKPVLPLEFSPFLYKHAVLHGQWMTRTDEFEHSDFHFHYGENLVGGVENVRHAVIDLLIDHGIPSRGHRINILYPDYKFGAVHEIPGTVDMTKYNFIQMFSEKKSPGKENP